MTSPVSDVSYYLNESDTIAWVDRRAPGAEDLELVATELGLHTLAIEAAVQPRQPGQARPLRHQPTTDIAGESVG